MKLSSIRVFAVCIVLACTAGAQMRIEPGPSFVLNFDYARFRYDDKSGYLEFYYGFYPRLITYESSDSVLRGGVNLRTVMANKQSGEHVIDQTAVLPMSVRDTSQASFRHTFVSKAGFAVPFGEYILSVTASDSLNPDRQDSITLRIEVKAYAPGVTVSDVELCSSVQTEQRTGDPFNKNSLEVIPNPTIVFGVMASPVVFSYAELYNLNPYLTYSIKSLIVDASNTIVKESSKLKKYNVPNAVEVGTTNATSIPSGRYTYQLVVQDDRGHELARSIKNFYVNNPHIKTAQVPATAVSSAELAGMTADELASEFERAQYFATDDEVKMFSQITSAEGRRDFLANFWSKVSERRVSLAPVVRSDYLRRVGIANERYRVMRREGWKSDRGRVFLIYGEADDIQRMPSSEQSKPYEIWSYFQIESGVQFFFVDRSGFGDYVLVHSTKRGETWDESWQRFLR